MIPAGSLIDGMIVFELGRVFASWPVSRVLYGLHPKAQTWRPFLWDEHCCPPQATNPDGKPETALQGFPCLPSLFGLAPGGVCRAASVAGRAVVSYTTLSPLPFNPPCGGPTGGLLSVALSLGLPPPDLVRRHVSAEPGLSSHAAFPPLHARPPGQLANAQ